MDWNYVNTLLSVIHQAATAGPAFQAIAGAAKAELDAYMAQPEEPEEEPTTPTPNGRRL